MARGRWGPSWPSSSSTATLVMPGRDVGVRAPVLCQAYLHLSPLSSCIIPEIVHSSPQLPASHLDTLSEAPGERLVFIHTHMCTHSVSPTRPGPLVMSQASFVRTLCGVDSN